MRALLASLLVILLVACGGGGDAPIVSAAAATPPPAQRTILGIGDSIMAGYIPGDGVSERLAQRESFTRELEALGKVIVTPVGGASTQAALSNQVAWLTTPMDPAMSALRPAVVVVMLGTNDAVSGVSREEALANVSKILQAFHGAKRVLVSPPRWDAASDPWMREWNLDLQALALVNGATFVDAYTPSLTRPWQCTPINHHPCEPAHREMGRLIAAAVQSALKG